MKKLFLILPVALILLSGCWDEVAKEAAKLQDDVTKSYDNVVKEVDNVTKTIEANINNVQKKVEDIENAKNAVTKVFE